MLLETATEFIFQMNRIVSYLQVKPPVEGNTYALNERLEQVNLPSGERPVMVHPQWRTRYGELVGLDPEYLAYLRDQHPGEHLGIRCQSYDNVDVDLYYEPPIVSALDMLAATVRVDYYDQSPEALHQRAEELRREREELHGQEAFCEHCGMYDKCHCEGRENWPEVFEDGDSDAFIPTLTNPADSCCVWTREIDACWRFVFQHGDASLFMDHAFGLGAYAYWPDRLAEMAEECKNLQLATRHNAFMSDTYAFHAQDPFA